MPEPHPTPESDTLVSAVLLACVGGLLDAIVYLNHGHVFANAMTGNVILLGISAFSRDWLQAVRHLVPLTGFLAGVAASRLLRVLPPDKAAVSVLTLELCVLFAAGFISATFPDMLFTAVIAFVSAFQVSTFRTVGRFSYNSTFITGNLREMSEGVVNSFVEADPVARSRSLAKSRKLSIICASFLLGAMLGAWAAPRFLNHALWLADPILLIVLIRITSRTKKQQ